MEARGGLKRIGHCLTLGAEDYDHTPDVCNWKVRVERAFECGDKRNATLFFFDFSQSSECHSMAHDVKTKFFAAESALR